MNPHVMMESKMMLGIGEGLKIPVNRIVRGANRKSLVEIEREMRPAKTGEDPQSRVTC